MLKWQIAFLEDAKIVDVRFQLFESHVILIYYSYASLGNTNNSYPDVEPVNIETAKL